jgi:hypothetical protein
MCCINASRGSTVIRSGFVERTLGEVGTPHLGAPSLDAFRTRVYSKGRTVVRQ